SISREFSHKEISQKGRGGFGPPALQRGAAGFGPAQNAGRSRRPAQNDAQNGRAQEPANRQSNSGPWAGRRGLKHSISSSRFRREPDQVLEQRLFKSQQLDSILAFVTVMLAKLIQQPTLAFLASLPVALLEPLLEASNR